ncbi:metal ABC transporter solute-binding protein [Leuconostoc mesenteroides]|uniref:metal ABC transporter solute-binding protein n=2 Tax=Leuconostoc TaxID=1243 RepID=UPI0009FCA996|nr:metal ABC transporter solute-binding protein [Leuconostoc mesenteroides]ORI45889.1 metal ABC transporter substrate-binding protein [Leuconostoc mesenteroides subsp. cremoris]ORI48183.1 metal ABC transporter substrate-binding protein [Leuconostoc mesenteroides subsp. cremoris]ORI49514.1 metal ABC transporter substrate-binding protein [Leuconostoc mesenteroides subsp. cremoris]ORI56136.1 metal ABC transporter substrate-binding protein [Leuconostoc mesenteroides subsp. cremoris]ORI60719.1 meta
MKKIIIVLSAIVVIVIGVALFRGNSSSSSNQKITIVASTDFYAEIAKTVVGEHGTATAIIKDANVSPEDYEPTTTVAKKVSGADIVLANGLGYDAWLNKLAKTSKNTKLIRVGEDVLNKKAGVNPYLWNDPETMSKTANYLATELGKKDPKNRDYYKKNAKKYVASLKPVNDLITKISKKADGQTVAQTEPVFEYMLDALGYKIMDTDFSEAIEEGNDPSPATLAALKSAITNHKIAFFVNNTQTSSSTVSNLIDLAKKNDIPIVNVTETIPNGENYVSWKLKELKAIEKVTQ